MKNFFRNLENDKRRWILLVSVIGISIFGMSKVIFGDLIVPTTDIVVKIGDGGGYEEGDIIHAFTSKQILNVHAQHVVHPKNMARTKEGTIEEGSLLEKYLEETQEYRFERISEKEVRRTNLWTGSVDIVSDIPNSKGEYMDVPLYLKRRLTLQPDQNKIFGQQGSEYWYGGGIRITDSNMDRVWSEIERKTRHARKYVFPFTENEKRSFAVVKVKNLTEAEANELVTPVLNEVGEVVKQRKHKVDLSKLKIDVKDHSELTDKTKNHDFREKKVMVLEEILK